MYVHRKFKTKLVQKKSSEDIVDEWNSLAAVRLKQIASGQDITFWHVLAPEVSNAVFSHSSDYSRLLDAGCGVGTLTNILYEKRRAILGIDPSSKSIELATNAYRNLQFFCCTIEELAISMQAYFEVIVANMVLMDVLDLEGFIKASSRLLCKDGYLIFTITHPKFWPTYYGYDKEAWFDYRQELIIESPFRISNDAGNELISTHVHRPLSLYLSTLEAAGFVVGTVKELRPTEDVERKYPAPWSDPRYVLLVCQKKP